MVAITVAGRAVGSLAIGALLATGACRGDEAGANPCQGLWADFDEAFPDDGVHPDYAPEEDATLIVKAENGDLDDRRLVISVAGAEPAVVDLMGSRGCDHPNVLTVGLTPSPGIVEVRAASEGRTASESITLTDGEPRWLVVQLSDDEIHTSVWDEPPQFG